MEKTARKTNQDSASEDLWQTTKGAINNVMDEYDTIQTGDTTLTV